MAENEEQMAGTVAADQAMSTNPMGFGAGLMPNDPEAKARLSEMQKVKTGDIFQTGIQGAALGMQAAQGQTNPLAAVVQAFAAGMGAPAQMYQEKQNQIQSAIGAMPFGNVVPEAMNVDSPYYVLRGIPYELASKAIAGIAQEVEKTKRQGEQAMALEKERQAGASALERQKQGYKMMDDMGAEAPTKELTEKAPGDMAARFGVPAVRKNPYYNLPEKVYEKVKGDSMGKALNESIAMSEKASNAEASLSELLRAKELITVNKLETGPLYDAARWKIFRSENAQEFATITEKLIPQMRQGMPGAASDKDVAMFRAATIGLDKDEAVNLKIINQGIAMGNRMKDHAEFMSNWATVYGDMNGAQAEWNKYSRENPLFSATGEVLDYRPYKTYFAEPAPAPRTIIVRKDPKSGKSYRYDSVTKENLGEE